MKRDRLFEPTTARTSEFAFDAEVAEVFDDMLVRSIPYYAEQQHMIRELLRRNGFEIVEPFFRWYNFIGFLCVKKPALR